MKHNWEFFLASIHNYIDLKSDIDISSKDFLKEGFTKYYGDYVRSTKTKRSDYTNAMVLVVDDLLDKYARGRGWFDVDGRSRGKDRVDKLFHYNVIGGRRAYYVYCDPIWIELPSFEVIAQFYYSCCSNYLQEVDKSTAFRGQLEESFMRFYSIGDPFKMSTDAETTRLVTMGGNFIEIIPATGEIMVRDLIRPSDYLTEVIELEPSQSEINEALATDPVDYFERAPMPVYRRFLKLTLGIRTDDVIDYVDDYMPGADERDVYYGGISSMLSGLAYALISKPHLHGMSFKKFFYNYGATNTGKSTHYRLMKALFPASVVNMDANQLLGDEAKFNFYKIFYKRWAFIDESDKKYLTHREMNKMKSLSSRDPQVADRKNLTALEGSNYALIYYASNSLPPTGDKAYSNRIHIDEWKHNFKNERDPRNKVELDEDKLLRDEGKWIFLTLLSFLSKLLETKEIPISLNHQKIVLTQEVETGDYMMRWYKKINPRGNRGEVFISSTDLYDNYLMFNKIASRPHRRWWVDRYLKDKKATSTVFSGDNEVGLNDSNFEDFIYSYHSRGTRPKSKRDMIEFLYDREHLNKLSGESSELEILFPEPLPKFEFFFFRRGVRGSRSKVVNIDRGLVDSADNFSYGVGDDEDLHGDKFD